MLARRLILLTFLALALAAAPARAAYPTAPADRYGVDLGRTLDASYAGRLPSALESARQAGAGWARALYSYGTLEPAPGSFNFGDADRYTAELHNRGIRIMGRITPAVYWNSTAPPGGGANGYASYPPADYGAFDSYVRAVASRYAGSVDAWEIGNEMNTAKFWNGTTGEYAHLLAVAYNAVHSADPGTPVMIGGVVPVNHSAVQAAAWFQALVNDPTYPGRAYMDVAAFHSYGLETVTQDLYNRMRSILSAAGRGSLPIWVTETGYSRVPAEQADPRYQGGNSGEAAWLGDRLPLLLRMGAAKVFWFKLMELDDEQNEFADTFTGLLASNLTQLPAYSTFRALVLSHFAPGLLSRSAKLRRKGKVRVKLDCPIEASTDLCTGRLKLKGLGSHGYSLAAGEEKKATIRLSHSGRERVRSRGKLRAKLRATPSGCTIADCQSRGKLKLKAG